MLSTKSILLHSLLLAGLVLANPSDGGTNEDAGCLTDQEAHAIIQTWISFFQAGFDPTVAQQVLSEDFYEQSGGFNFITAQNVRCNPILTSL